MSGDAARPGLWVRVIADEGFRDAVVEDPLRALARFPDVAVSSDQVRRLDEMSRDERRELVMRVVREAHVKGAEARFGGIGRDGRLGR